MSVSRYPSDSTSSKNYVATWTANAGARVQFGEALKQNANYYVQSNASSLLIGPNYLTKDGLIYIPNGVVISEAFIGSSPYQPTATITTNTALTSPLKYAGNASYELVTTQNGLTTLDPIFYVSTNGGLTWSQTFPANYVGGNLVTFSTNMSVSGIAANSDGNFVIAATKSGVGTFLVSTGGPTTTIGGFNGYTDVYHSPDKTRYYGITGNTSFEVHDSNKLFPTAKTTLPATARSITNQIAEANGKVVVLTSAGTGIMVSNDYGQSFTVNTAAGGWLITSGVHTVVSNGSIFVAQVAQSFIRVSTNALNWSSQQRLVNSGSNMFYKAPYFYSDATLGVYYISTNGTTWSTATVGASYSSFGQVEGSSSMIYANTTNVYPPALRVSTDGITWATAVLTLATSASVTGITYLPDTGIYTAFTNTPSVHYSTNALTWSSGTVAVNYATSMFATDTLGTGFKALYISSAQGIQLLPTQTGRNGIFGSKDGINWGPAPTYDGTNGIVLKYDQGAGTASINTQTTVNTNNVFISAVVNGPATASEDGNFWFAAGTLAGSSVVREALITGISHISGNRYMAVSTGGGVWISSTLTSWTTSPAIAAGVRHITVASSTGQIIVGGISGAVYTSTDSTTWTVRATGLASNITSLTNGPLGVAATDSSGSNFSISTDGITWTLQQAATADADFIKYNKDTNRYVLISAYNATDLAAEYFALNPYTAISMVYNGRVRN